MPRASAYVNQHNTKAKLFAQTLVGVPTPWITTGWIEIDRKTDDAKQVQVKFRLWVRRHGKGLHVEVHKESPSYAGMVQLVSTKRRSVHQLQTMGLRLVRTSMQDPTTTKEHPVYVWNKGHPLYMERKENATIVAQQLHAFFNPRRGRPRGATPIVGDAVNPGLPVGMREKRRTEFLRALDRTLDIMDPLLERMQDARRMRCYTQDQQKEMRNTLSMIVRSTKTLRQMVYTDKVMAAQENVQRRKLTTEEILGIAPISDRPPQPTALPPQVPSTIKLDDLFQDAP